jgi:uncharacterized alpha-E superfamily protein
MLSRHAENLFWAGRYVERASDTARMLDVTYHGLLESPLAESRRAWLDLLDVLHLRGQFERRHDVATAATVSEFLVLDPANPGAIVPSVERARENARAVRELISTELWESINTFRHELLSRDLRHDLAEQPSELYGLVKRRCQAVAGTADETMTHDDGWRFLMLGWMLERADMTSRLLNVRLARYSRGPDELNFHQALQLLKSASALEAFRKAHSASMTPAHVVEFLLLSPTFPRSVLYCLRSAEEMLAELDVPGRLTRAQRVLGRLRADLEYVEVAELMDGRLDAFLDGVSESVRKVSELVALQFFRNSEDFALLQSLDTAV